MRRRSFIKSASLASIAISNVPLSARSFGLFETDLDLLENFTLKGYLDEQEESPVLVNGKNKSKWLFSLRRRKFPVDQEQLSCFSLINNKWIEIGTVTAQDGQYESPTAVCQTNGFPMVAWCSIENKKWHIRTSSYNGSSFSNPHSFKELNGNSIHPVLHCSKNGAIYLAWEQFHKGKFSIYVSKHLNDSWTNPIKIYTDKENCFYPAIHEKTDGTVFIAYTYTEGFHQNIEMLQYSNDLSTKLKTIPVAVGGERQNRVNINCKPALAIDKNDVLWISYESNRKASRLNDGDNYTGDKCCALVAYVNGEICTVKNQSKWLFEGENDQVPTFFKDENDQLFIATHCGGTFDDPFWKYRISWFIPGIGWEQPRTFLETKVKGVQIPPAISFSNHHFWFATCIERTFNHDQTKDGGITRSRLNEFKLMKFKAPQISGSIKKIDFEKTNIKGYLPDELEISTYSGHPKKKRIQKKIDGKMCTLMYGNMHEHSNASNCWPAGTDGTLHDDYRFGMYSEGYDFFGMTDHASSTTELYWRKSLRIADFYNESEAFVAIPAIEWTLQSDPSLDDIQYGAGHYNIIFGSTADAKKYIRNEHEIYCPRTPESTIAPTLWNMLDRLEINCVTIPHHPADKVHPMDWNVHNEKYVPIVEIFQCRGNNEYPGAPREKNLERHITTKYRHAFIDYALKEKKYQMGFIASGDHNSMGVGVAALWVEEVSRQGILNALKKKRTFATTGDKMVVSIDEINTEKNNSNLISLKIGATGQSTLKSVEILKNSKVVKTFDIDNEEKQFSAVFRDVINKKTSDVCYYYVRATQVNNEIGWSSPLYFNS